MRFIAFSILMTLSFCLTAQGVSLEKVNGLGTSNRINDLLLDNQGTVWIGADGGLFNVIGKTIKPVIQTYEILSLANDNSNVYAALSSNEIYKNDKLHFSIEENVRITCIATGSNKLWVGTQKSGVLVYNLGSKKLVDRYTQKNSKLKSNHINFIHRDKDRLIWLGTDKGVIRVEDDKWKLFDEKLKMVAMTESADELWLLSDQDMWLIHSKGKRWEPLSVQQGWSAGRVNDICVDQEKKIYIASQELVRVDPFSDEIESYSDAMGYLSQECLAIVSDKNKNVWFGTKSSGLYVTAFGLEESPLSAVNVVNQESDCEGNVSADVSIKIFGGKAPYRLQWSDSQLVGADLTGIAAGNYGLTITDADNNQTEQAINIQATPVLTIDVYEIEKLAKQGVSNGKARVGIEGGEFPYNIKWSSGEKSKNAKRLSAGNQSVTVTDKNGCSVTETFEMEVGKIMADLDINSMNEGQTLNIKQLYFDANSSEINQESYDVLDELYGFLESNPNIVVEIGGHTNNVPTHEFCDALSSSRAKSVADYLYEKGIAESRLSHKGYGKRKPISSNETAGGRRKNQRVEMKVLKIL